VKFEKPDELKTKEVENEGIRNSFIVDFINFVNLNRLCHTPIFDLTFYIHTL